MWVLQRPLLLLLFLVMRTAVVVMASLPPRSNQFKKRLKTWDQNTRLRNDLLQQDDDAILSKIGQKGWQVLDVVRTTRGGSSSNNSTADTSMTWLDNRVRSLLLWVLGAVVYQSVSTLLSAGNHALFDEVCVKV